MVLPGDSEILLGIPLEGILLFIHPYRWELAVSPNHPYFAQRKLKQSACSACSNE